MVGKKTNLNFLLISIKKYQHNNVIIAFGYRIQFVRMHVNLKSQKAPII